MTHRLQVRVDRQITPRPGRNITRKWVYERSFSVHLLTQDSLNSPRPFSQLLFQVWVFVSITNLPWSVFKCASTLFDFWRLCCLDCDTLTICRTAVDTDPPLSAQSRLFSRLSQGFIHTDGTVFRVLWMFYCYWVCVFCGVKWWVFDLWGCAYKQCRVIVYVLWFDLMLECSNVFLPFHSAGQQSQQPQDYTKAWEEYYKKQGECSSRLLC